MGRLPVGLQRMLRMYFVQHWFNLAARRAVVGAEHASMPTRHGGSEATTSSSLPRPTLGASARACLSHPSQAGQNTLLAKSIPRVTMAMRFPFRAQG